MRKHYARVVRDTQRRVVRALRAQNMDKNSPYYGAYVMPNGVYMQKLALYQLASLAAASSPLPEGTISPPPVYRGIS
jgi:hypothetical protein